MTAKLKQIVVGLLVVMLVATASAQVTDNTTNETTDGVDDVPGNDTTNEDLADDGTDSVMDNVNDTVDETVDDMDNVTDDNETSGEQNETSGNEDTSDTPVNDTNGEQNETNGDEDTDGTPINETNGEQNETNGEQIETNGEQVNESAVVTIKEWYPKGLHYVFVCETPDGFEPFRHGYSWWFGDGEKQRLVDNRDVYHIYDMPGNYEVKCTATDGETTHEGVITVNAVDDGAGNGTEDGNETNGNDTNGNETNGNQTNGNETNGAEQFDLSIVKYVCTASEEEFENMTLEEKQACEQVNSTDSVGITLLDSNDELYTLEDAAFENQSFVFSDLEEGAIVVAETQSPDDSRFADAHADEGIVASGFGVVKIDLMQNTTLHIFNRMDNVTNQTG